jgi:hypothetical protein
MSRDANFDLVRDPDEWKSGAEPATEAQLLFLESLFRRNGEDVPDSLELLTKAEASLMIDELQQFGKAG